MNRDISVILLAGGKGTRFGANLPKQFLPLCGRPAVHYSYYFFSHFPEIAEIVVVCSLEYQKIFQNAPPPIPLRFALPGVERQDSVCNGLQAVNDQSEWVCIHDAARPLITKPLMERVSASARQCGAAAAGRPVPFTVKEIDEEGFVCHTLNRSKIWEIQTPQIIRTNWLKKGFRHIQQHRLSVTDDVSIIETLGLPVKIVNSDEENIKMTTKYDVFLAEKILTHRANGSR